MSKITGFTMFFMVVLASSQVPLYQLPYCMDVVLNFDWCAGYLEGNWDNVVPPCCRGLYTLNSIAQGEGPRRICQCIEDMANHQLGIPYIPCRIDDLYVKCQIHLSFPISQSMNCSA